jgi:hypothetical protein
VGAFQPPTKCVGETEETFLVAFSTDGGTVTGFDGVICARRFSFVDDNFSAEFVRYDFSTTGGVVFDFSATTGRLDEVVSTVLLIVVDDAIVVGREFVELFFDFSFVGEIKECRFLSFTEF